MFIKGAYNKIDLHSIHFRNKSFSYNKGDVCYCDTAPIWCKFICVESGITSDENIDFSYISKKGEVVIDGTVKWKIEDLREGQLNSVINPNGVYSIGDIIWQYTLKEDFLFLDGTSVNDFAVNYLDLYDFLTEHNLIVDTQAKYNENKALWFYNSSTDVMVKANFLDKAVWGGSSIKENKAGLPDILGYCYGNWVSSTTGGSNRFENGVGSGALRAFTAHSTRYAYQGGTYWGSTLEFRASASNSIYGSSQTVQPPSISLLPQIKCKK